MKKKKLQLSEIRIKSFTALVPLENQRTAKGGQMNAQNRLAYGQGSWTEIKSGKESIRINPTIRETRGGGLV